MHPGDSAADTTEHALPTSDVGIEPSQVVADTAQFDEAAGAGEQSVANVEAIAVTPAISQPAMLTAEPVPPAQLGPWRRMGHEVVAGVQTLLSAAVYATLIVTFGFQVAR